MTVDELYDLSDEEYMAIMGEYRQAVEDLTAEMQQEDYCYDYDYVRHYVLPLEKWLSTR